MTAYKHFRRRAKRIKEKIAGMLPLEELIADKLAKKARLNRMDSHLAIMDLATVRGWDQMVHPKILENDSKNMLAVSLVRRNIHDIIEQGKGQILEKLSHFSSTLSRGHFDMLAYCLSIAGMKNTIARLSGYPFIERNLGFEAQRKGPGLEEDLIGLKDFCEVLCHYIDCDGGPKAFAQTPNHNYVLLMYSAFHTSHAARIRAIEDFFKIYLDDDLYEIKEVLLNTPYPKSAEFIIDKLLSSRMMSLVGDEGTVENSLIVWYLDCLNVLGDESPVTKMLEEKLEQSGINKENLDNMLHELFGVPKGPKN